MTFRIATTQAEARPGDVTHNVHRTAELTAHAAAAGASLVVFPEAFLTGYGTEVFAGPLPRLDDSAWLAPIQRVVDEARTITSATCHRRAELATRRTHPPASCPATSASGAAAPSAPAPTMRKPPVRKDEGLLLREPLRINDRRSS